MLHSHFYSLINYLTSLLELFIKFDLRNKFIYSKFIWIIKFMMKILKSFQFDFFIKSNHSESSLFYSLLFEVAINVQLH
jgi:hypothetical protein